ncbi:unnamed protein product, partial [Mesorhabditis belari]|uniref:Intimal thickness related receptor IRP domain-containing protein n=1 Tax=Mesorhabditis belari TaxID=2138241 RepID=A0AAF3FSP4_9BILA
MECHPEVKQGLEWTICQGTQRFQSSRPRWWYFVISNCKPASWRGLSVFAEYKIEMKNGDSTFLKHFSADEYYVLPVDTGFLLLELILYILSIFLARALKARHFLHSTFKLCRVAILFEIISLSVLVWSYCGYGWHGIWILHSKNTGYYVRGVQQSLFLLFLLLVAKGYTITA